MGIIIIKKWRRILPIRFLIPSLAIKCEQVDRSQKHKQKNQPITWLIPNPLTRNLERKTRRRSSILNESETFVFASFVSIHTRSEDSSDSNSDSDFASVASVNQANGFN